jgi:hypothetical protein
MTPTAWRSAIVGVLALWAPLAIAQVDVLPPSVEQSQVCPGTNATALGLTPRCSSQFQHSGPANLAGQSPEDATYDSRVLFATGALGGYDSAFDGAAEAPGASGAGGWIDIEALRNGDSTYLMFQNVATAIDYQIGNGALQYLDTALLETVGSLSPRTTWTLDIDNSFGNDSLRLIELPVGEDNTEVGSYGIHSGNVLNNQVTGRIFLQTSPAKQWIFSVRNSFRYFFDDDARANTIHGRAEYRLQTSERTKWGFFEETAQESGAASCTTQSGGIFYQRRISPIAAFEGAAGPVVGTKGCGTKVTANLYGALSVQPWKPTSLYAWGYRKLNDSDFGTATYENTVQGGMVQKLALRTWVKLQGGWVEGTTPSNSTPFRGTYVISLLEHALRGGFLISVSAQHFNWSGIPTIAPSRTLVAGSFSWSPGNHTPGNMPAPLIR